MPVINTSSVFWGSHTSTKISSETLCAPEGIVTNKQKKKKILFERHLFNVLKIENRMKSFLCLLLFVDIVFYYVNCEDDSVETLPRPRTEKSPAYNAAVPPNVQSPIPEPNTLTDVQSTVDAYSKQPTSGPHEIKFIFGKIPEGITELKRLILHYKKNKKNAESLATAQKYYIEFLEHCRTVWVVILKIIRMWRM